MFYNGIAQYVILAILEFNTNMLVELEPSLYISELMPQRKTFREASTS